jgi:hypothetical protein
MNLDPTKCTSPEPAYASVIRVSLRSSFLVRSVQNVAPIFSSFDMVWVETVLRKKIRTNSLTLKESGTRSGRVEKVCQRINLFVR